MSWNRQSGNGVWYGKCKPYHPPAPFSTVTSSIRMNSPICSASLFFFTVCHGNCHHILKNAYTYWKLSNSSDYSYGLFRMSDGHCIICYFLLFSTVLHMIYQYRIKGPWVDSLGQHFFKNIFGIIFKEISSFNDNYFFSLFVNSNLVPAVTLYTNNASNTKK